jgi:hypothetical protein
VLGQLDSTKAYVAALPVDGGAKNSLTGQLTRAAAQYRSGRLDDAVAAVQAFTSQVSTLARNTVLTAEQATFLRATATAVTTHILE